MAQPVWILSVDLQTKTATFQSGLADAARSARGAFSDIKSGSDEMGGHIGSNMFASRHAIMAVSEAFGVQMPRAITALITHIGPLGAALESAFPFAAIALGAVLVIEKLAEIKEKGFELTEDQIKFGTAAQNAFNKLDEKLLQAGIRADELHNNHLGALKKQLELIDKQSMGELIQEFTELEKSADKVFGDLQGHWYTLGIGSDGAKHALTEFSTQYQKLMSEGKQQEATDLLKGTRDSAQKVLDAQNAVKKGNTGGTQSDEAWARSLAYMRQEGILKAAGVGHTENEMKAQQTLVDALNNQLTVESKIASLKNAESGNAKTEVDKEAGARAAEAERQAAEHGMKMGELRVAAERDAANAQEAIHEATIAERLATDTKLENEQYAVQLRGNQQLIAALDKGGKDYNNQLAALHQKAEELTLEHQNRLAALGNKATVEQYKKDLTDLEQSEREKINATQQGSAQRLAAIDAAIKQEQSRNLQDTQFYRELLTERVEVERQAAAEAAKIQADLGKEAAANAQEMGQLALAAEQESWALRDSALRASVQRRIAEEMNAEHQEFALKDAALKAEAAALDKNAKDYEVKLVALQNKREQLIRAHENRVTQIEDQAQKERNARILSAENQFNDTLAGGLTKVLMAHQTFGAMMSSIGDQITSGMIQNAIKSILANDMTKESDAAAAARKAYLAGMHFPFPVNVVMGPVLGAAAFASVMAFNEGTDAVPGVGRGDVTPAMLTPGEGVVPGGVMDGLSKVARSGGFDSGGSHYHAHVSPTYNLQALDSEGMDKVLAKHSDTLTKHVTTSLRKLNK